MRSERPGVQTAVIAALFTLLTAVGGYAFNAVDQRMRQAEERVVRLESSLSNKSERLAAVEVEIEALEQTLKGIDKKLDTLINLHYEKAKK